MIDNKTIRKVIMLNKMLPSGSPTYENREAEGAVANFTTNTVQPFVKCECTINATESGTSVLNVEQRGVNLFDEDLEEGWLNQTTGEPQEYSNRMRSKNFCSIVPNQSYYIKCGNNEEAYWYFYDSNKIYLRRRLIRNTTTITQADECFFKVGIVGISSYSDDISLNYPSTDTTYEPYTGSTYTIALGQTVYGGTADIVGGVGSKTMAEIDLGNLSWTKQTMQNGSGFTARIEDGEPIGNVNSSGALCEIYPEDISVQNPYYIADETFKYGGTYFGKRNVTILDSTKENMTASEFKTAMTGIKFAYPLETPTEYTFTGQPINSYLGVNNLWTDSGEVLDVEYRADMNLLIAELGG